MYTVFIFLSLSNIIFVDVNSITSANVVKMSNIREQRTDEVVTLIDGHHSENRRIKKDIGGCGVQFPGSLYVYKSNETYAMQCDSSLNTLTPCQMSALIDSDSHFFFMAMDERKKLRLSIKKMDKEQCLYVHNSIKSEVANVLTADCDGSVVSNEYVSEFVLEDSDDGNHCSVQTSIGGQLYYLSEDTNQNVIAALKNTIYLPIEFNVTAALLQSSTSTTTTTTTAPNQNQPAICGTIALAPSTIIAASLVIVIIVHLAIG